MTSYKQRELCNLPTLSTVNTHWSDIRKASDYSPFTLNNLPRHPSSCPQVMIRISHSSLPPMMWTCPLHLYLPHTFLSRTWSSLTVHVSPTCSAVFVAPLPTLSDTCWHQPPCSSLLHTLDILRAVILATNIRIWWLYAIHYFHCYFGLLSRVLPPASPTHCLIAPPPSLLHICCQQSSHSPCPSHSEPHYHYHHVILVTHAVTLMLNFVILFSI